MSAFIITRIQVGDCDLQRLRGDGSASVGSRLAQVVRERRSRR